MTMKIWIWPPQEPKNPAQFLYCEPEEDLEHWCLETIDLQTKLREDLLGHPLIGGEILFIDGSSRVIHGKRLSGYAIVDRQNMTVLEKGNFPANWSTQCCESYALLKGLKWLNYKRRTIYTDSRYAYGVVHTFGKIWTERGFTNSKGKALIHEGLVKAVLEALRRPLEIAAVHVKGHQEGDSKEIEGNNLADQRAKRAAMEETEKVLPSREVEGKEDGDKTDEDILVFSEKEQEELQKHAAIKNSKGEWKMPDGRQILNKALTRKILENLHTSIHWGTQALYDHFRKTYMCTGVFEIAKTITWDCMICQRITKKINVTTAQGGEELAMKTFQNFQIDFTDLPQVQRFKYLLVMVDHLTDWVEAYPTMKATAEVVSRILLEQIVPRYGIINTIDLNTFYSKTFTLNDKCF